MKESIFIAMKAVKVESLKSLSKNHQEFFNEFLHLMQNEKLSGISLKEYNSLSLNVRSKQFSV